MRRLLTPGKAGVPTVAHQRLRLAAQRRDDPAAPAAVEAAWLLAARQAVVARAQLAVPAVRAAAVMAAAEGTWMEASSNRLSPVEALAVVYFLVVVAVRLAPVPQCPRRLLRTRWESFLSSLPVRQGCQRVLVLVLALVLALVLVLVLALVLVLIPLRPLLRQQATVLSQEAAQGQDLAVHALPAVEVPAAVSVPLHLQYQPVPRPLPVRLLHH